MVEGPSREGKQVYGGTLAVAGTLLCGFLTYQHARKEKARL